MTVLTEIKAYTDSRGNEIRFTGEPIFDKINILFRGSGNLLKVAPGARIRQLNIRFDCDNGVCDIGSNGAVAPLRAIIRVGQDAHVVIGDDVSTTTAVQISSVEGATVSIGNDTMIAGNVKIRGDDGHPIFDIHTGLRVNPASDIAIGNHVWLGIDSTVMGGAVIGSGSIVGTKALVTKAFPNNCVIAGVPAKIIRTDVAWERPHLSLVRPYYKPDDSTVSKSDYWSATVEL